MIPLVLVLSGVAAFHSFRFFPYLTAFFISALFVLFIIRRRYVLMAALALGVLFAAFRYEPAPEFSFPPHTAKVTGFFDSPAVRREGGCSQSLRVLSGLPGESIDVLSGGEFEIGRLYELTLKVLTPKERLNPGARKREAYAALIDAKEKGETKASPRLFFNRARGRLQDFALGAFPPDSAALILSVTTGQRHFFSPELRDAFNSTGLAHLLSISGTHFALFSILLFGIFRTLTKRLPIGSLERLTVYLTPSQAAAVASFPLVCLYLGISGASIPALRSFIMTGLFLIGLIIERKGAWLNFLLFAAVAIVLYEPDALFDLSFQLSFLAVLFIGAAEDRFRPRGFLRKALLVSMAAFAGTAPLVACHFHNISLISPVSNLIVTPLVGFALVPLALAGSFLYLLTGNFAIEPVVGFISKASLFFVDAFSAIPYRSVGVPPFPVALIFVWYAGFVLYWRINPVGLEQDDERPGVDSGAEEAAQPAPPVRRLFGRFGWLLPVLPALIYFSITLTDEKKLAVTFLDAGHADASVVELPDGKTIVIDSGRTGREAADYLRLRGIEKVDALVLTHAHPDHAGGAWHLMGRFRIGEVWDSGKLVYPDGMSIPRRRPLKRGDVIEGRGYSIQVLHPYEGFYTRRGSPGAGENNDSLVLRLSGRESSFLFASDVEEEAEEDISCLGKRLKSDVLKVPHHGGKTSAHEFFIKLTSPRVSVVTSSRRPNARMERLLGGSDIFLTGKDGAIKVTESDDDPEVKTFGDFKVREASNIVEEFGNIKRLFTVW